MSRPSTPLANREPRLEATDPADHIVNPAISITSASPTKPTPSPPTTPSRGRHASRYPAHLSRGDPGRVPLHKRGKSRTYERLEDLLREAGYKETRIFTPESERTGTFGDVVRGGRVGSMRGGVGAVVDFLAGWMPGAGRTDPQGSDEEMCEGRRPSPPPSPLAGKRQRPLSPIRVESIDNLSDISSPMGSPRMHPSRLPRLTLPPREPPRFPSAASESLRAYAAAQGYLRHMASAPSIPKASGSNSKALVQHRYFSGLERPTPPMPSNWLDAVTKAVRGTTDSELHVGGPRPSSRHSNRPTRPGKENQSVLCGYAGKSRPAGSLRAQTAPGEVTTVRVVCRSAPASRSSSRVGHKLSQVAGKAREAPRRKATDDVPTLASTRLENDIWGHQWVDGRRVSSPVSEYATDASDDDDDDDEIDLARLLVPPKRQKSIRSLRQHLHRSESARALRGSALRQCEPWNDDDVTGYRSSDARGRGRRSSNDEDSEDASRWMMNGTYSQGAKKRRTIPGTWSHFGSNHP